MTDHLRKNMPEEVRSTEKKLENSHLRGVAGICSKTVLGISEQVPGEDGACRFDRQPWKAWVTRCAAAA